MSPREREVERQKQTDNSLQVSSLTCLVQLTKLPVEETKHKMFGSYFRQHKKYNAQESLSIFIHSNFKFRKFRNTANSKAEKMQQDRIKGKFRKADNKQLSVGKVKLQTQKNIHTSFTTD